MKKVNKIISIIKIFLLFLLVASISTAIAQVFANELDTIPIVSTDDSVAGTVATYSAKYTISKSSFQSYFDDSAYTALSTNHAIYCLKHGKALFDQHDRCTLTRDHADDVDMDNAISFSYGGSPSPSTHSYGDYMESTESGNQTTESNIRYKISDTDLRSVTTDFGTYTGNIIAYAATFENSADTYHNPGQYAIWEKTGNNGDSNCNNDLYKAGYAVDQLEEQISIHGETPTVTAIKKDSNTGCGTILDGTNYKIGPFKMSDYAYVASSYVKSYSGKDLSTQKDLVGGIASGYITLNNGTKLYFGTDVTISYSKNGDNNRSGTYWNKPEAYTCPYPNSEFYIIVPRSKCGDATTLTSFSFEYRKTRAEGSGWVANGEYVLTSFTRENIVKGCDYYSASYTFHNVTQTFSDSDGGPRDCAGTYSHDCDTYNHSCECKGDHFECVHTSHDSTCYKTDSKTNKTTLDCQHSHDSKCYEKTITGCHCSCTGHNCKHTQNLTLLCTHSHQHCRYFTWKGTSTVAIPQPLLGVKEAKVKVTETTVTSTVNVRLTTDLTINKYITKVEHVGESGVIYGENSSRSRASNSSATSDWKKANTVKIERGDKVTYNIDIINKQDQKVVCQIKDILPTSSSDQTFTPSINGWLEIAGNSTKTIVVTLRATADSGVWENYTEIITKNSGDVDYNRTVYTVTDNRHNGPVVNVAELNGGVIKDSDFYEIKQYNVNIDKYIYNVNHDATNVSSSGMDTSLGTTEARSKVSGMTEDTKASNPVYVEYGDKVIYQIKVYNTTSTYDSSIDRTASPYWEPDKVYVNVEDTLPSKYTDLKIEVSNGSGSISEVNGGKFTITNMMVPANGVTTITVTLTVDEHTKGTVETNTAKLVDGIRNINKGTGTGNNVDDKYCVVNNVKSLKTESKDYYKLNNYNAFIDKYIYSYDEKMQKENNSNSYTNNGIITNDDGTLKTSRMNSSSQYSTLSDGNVTDTIRETNSKDTYKKEHPVSVEKYETITYAIKVSNEATTVNKSVSTGSKPATQVRTTKITDKMQYGLTQKKVTAKMYNSDGSICTRYAADGSVKVTVSSATTVTENGVNYNQYDYTIGNETILNPGEYIVYYVQVLVSESNMYLYSLENTATITTLTNINNTSSSSKQVQTTTYSENISKQQKSSEYVRMKDLVIAGEVWLDINRDGLMNESQTTDTQKEYYNINDSAMKKDVVVRLYKSDGTLLRTTKTDENGLYTFGRDENLTWYGTYNHDTGFSQNATYQRVDKATSKDANGNYTANSTYISYYIEYEYDGVLYKSTEFYAGMSNLTTNDGKYNDNYLIDSNAAEFTKVREEFNTKYEYISYNVAYDVSLNKTNDMVYDKTNHTSQLMEDNSRLMTSRSFIVSYESTAIINACKQAMNSCGASKWKQCSNHWKQWQTLIAMNIIDESKYANTTEGRKAAQADLKSIYNEVVKNANSSGNTEMTKYLWLYTFSDGVDNTIPETNYLKHINLGLELREDVDIALTKDVYKVKTTIDGEEMEYDYNQNTGLNGDMATSTTNKYLQNYIIAEPYGLELYESDYKYRVSQYLSDAVKNYKGINGESELNVEVTFRITVDNKAVTDDDTIPGATDTKLDVKINEILDLYDENFIKYVEDATKDVITVKTKDDNGFLVDKTINIAEAWYFKKASDVISTDNVLEGRYSISNSTDVLAGAKPTYIENASGEYVKVGLTLSNTSSRGEKGKFSEKNNDFTQDGYNTLYITGMGNEVIHEGENLDIYVKYVVDKAKLEVEITNENYEETTSTSKETASINGGSSEIITVTSSSTALIERSLKLAERTVSDFKTKYGRGTENIAQVNAYSVWYTDGKPASIVDMDSNPGNIGIKNDSTGVSPKSASYKESTTSADNVDYYEDTTYKTGIEIAADGTENTPTLILKKYGKVIIPIPTDEKLTRTISGMVWDDSRTDALGTGGETQYIGDGLYDEQELKNNDAKINEAVTSFYKDSNVKEEKDLAVRNAKAQFIEIVEIPDGDNINYYEQILTDVTWKQVQHIRTDSDGKYQLEGFVPGKYIVRFTYGDTVEENQGTTYDSSLEAQQDMLIFNGQDYKSTQYTTDLSDDETDVDEIMRKLEEANKSDARDDEIRRLEVNTYSEVMTNEVAEILKGISNGTDLTGNVKNPEANTEEQLKALTENTYMNAETVEFLVKAEKLTETQTPRYVVKYIANIGANETAQDIYYKELQTIEYVDTSSRDFKIENIDFGIEYRPESEISLVKEINEMKIVTEDGNTLVDLYFYTEGEGDNISHHIDMEKSTGTDLVQFISNDYTTQALVSKLTTEETQGFIYIQVDNDILQGCKIEITYKFKAENDSEIDRISRNLNAIRYRGNKATTDLVATYGNSILDTNYTASGTGRNIVYADTYATDQYGDVYRNKRKTMTTDGSSGYFGKYVGYGYYTGELSDLDTIASLKFDKILDYVDTDLEFEQETNNNNLSDRYWTKTQASELFQYLYSLRKYRNLSEPVGSMSIANVDPTDLRDADGIQYSSLVVSVDDRTVDIGDANEASANSVNNNDLARFLLPNVMDNTENKTDSVGTIYLPVSKVISAETDTDDMTYENIAEIIQFTTLTARRTNFATTIGNADVKTTEKNDSKGSIEFITASYESDTAATETITLTPPTGLMRNRRAIVNVIDTAKTGTPIVVIIVAVVAIGVFGTKFAVRKYKKRRIK